MLLVEVRELNKAAPFFCFQVIKNGQCVPIKEGRHRMDTFQVGERLFVRGVGEIAEVFGEQVKVFDNGYARGPTVELLEEGTLLTLWNKGG